MKITRFEIDGLLRRAEPIAGDLSSDLAIFTGRNGAGKTSVLKLIWSIVSGNILVGLDEVEFQRARVVTDLYDCTVHRLGRRTCKVEIVRNNERVLLEDDEHDEDNVGFSESAEDKANPILMGCGTSVFFPTFRRIEGGFSIARRRQNILTRTSRAKSDLEEALVSLSRHLTNESHVFVSAISTSDIVTLLLRRYADLSEEANRSQAATSQEVIDAIKRINLSEGSESEQLQTAISTIRDIYARIERMEGDRKAIMAPMDAMQALVRQVFKHIGIQISARISFGDAANAVDSDSLSAGEKQLLSFVCYNAFYKDAVIFIDEPELSLHADWQRQLFGILSNQQSTNQFIVATHSPFIYAKYPDKEVEIVADRGDTEEKLQAGA